MGKGVIIYTYDAGGNKLQKTITDNSVLRKTIKTITTYLGGAVFQTRCSSPAAAGDYANRLEFIAHEEGRLRPVRNAAGAVAALVYDYFLKDHLGNVRMVLTEEQKSDLYPAATMETASAAVEEALYGNVSNTRSDKPPRYPADSYTNPNNKVAKVSGSGQKTGPSLLLKVMAGDKFNLRVSSWYRTAGAVPAAPKSLLPDLVASFLSSFPGGGGGLKEGVSGALLQSSGVITTAATGFLNNRAYSSVKPKAYVSWMVLDEQFKLVAGSSGAEQVGGDGEFKVHVKKGLGISKNGYLYVYVSNEMPNVNVFFDNLQVTHVRGPVLEETHYYPFGLHMAGISSKAAGGIQNRYKFNDGTELENKEFSDGSGLELYATDYRSYDPQIGRFHQLDPIAEMSESWSLYTYANNNPLFFNDPLGLIADTAVTPTPPPVPAPTPGFDPDHPKELAPVVVTGKNKSDSGGFWSGVLDVVQTGIDIVGLIPVVGEIADGTNALIYLARGDKTNAALSAAAMIPIAGWAATGTKIVVKTVQLTAKTRKAAHALKLAERILGKGYKEIAPGVFRSADGLKQFRMTASDLAGKGMNGVPHVDIETFDPSNLNVPIKNYHILVKD